MTAQRFRRCTLGAAALWLAVSTVGAQDVSGLDSTCHSAAVAQDTLRPLFIIERNKNANIVCYDARFLAGRIDVGNPVAAYWIMRAQRGQHTGLNALERRFAYGFDLERADTTAWWLSMRAFRARKVLVREETADGATVAVRAEVCIGGRQARFDRLYIMAKERFLRQPQVIYVELFGRDLQTGEALTEKIVPGSAPNAAACPTA